MHKSKLSGFIIDCKSADLEEAADFWSKALGAPCKQVANIAVSPYVELAMQSGEPYVEVQVVEHDSRVHLDIETDDISAEVRRLESLGAKKIAEIKSWIVMEAPTGQRFCVVTVVSANFDKIARAWGEE
jgi:predicted enzyme related to lactoylglutathione lyase